jgi:leader peptidase (prepilin peptidase)/N-methyltransferase
MLIMIILPILAGLLAGIFINLLADSLSANVSPDGKPVRFAPSVPACATCRQPRSLIAWSGLLAYLTGRHRCPSCAAPLSRRHLLVEWAMIAICGLVWIPSGARAQTSPLLTNVFNCLYGEILVLILVTDLEHRLVPHVIMLPAISLATLGAFINPIWSSPGRALLGGALGLICGLALYGGGILFVRVLSRVRGQPISETAFGFGDVTLLTFIGLIVGAPEILLALAIGVLTGGVFSILWLVLRGLVQKRSALFTAIPYAPFLIFGGAIMLVFGREIIAWYLRGM